VATAVSMEAGVVSPLTMVAVTVGVAAVSMVAVVVGSLAAAAVAAAAATNAVTIFVASARGMHQHKMACISWLTFLLRDLVFSCPPLFLQAVLPLQPRRRQHSPKRQQQHQGQRWWGRGLRQRRRGK
jgi:hypothetical protein